MNYINTIGKKIIKIKNSEIYMRLRLKQSLLYKNGGKLLEVNDDGFFPFVNRVSLNSTYLKNKKNIDEVICDISENANKLFEYGYYIKGNDDGHFILEYSESNGTSEQLKEQNEIRLKIRDKLSEYFNYVFKEEEEIKSDCLVVTFTVKKEDMVFKTEEKYKKFLLFWKELIELTGKRGICHKIKIPLFFGFSSKVFEKIENDNFDNFLRILIENMEYYEKNISKDKEQELANEKIFQQKIMNILNNNHKDILKESIIECPNSVFTKDTIPFEMEWVEKSVNARIDNIFLEGDTVVLCEVKYNESVIGGTNGLHKHLDDLYKLFSDSKKKTVFINKINKCIKERFSKLKEFGLEYDVLPRYEKFEYLILCGYGDSKYETVNSELKKFSDLRYCDVIKKSEITHTVEDYCKLLSELEVPVKIVVVDENLKKYESK